MEITVDNSLGSKTEIIIEGNIKSLSDNDKLKNSILNTWNEDTNKPLDIIIKDSFIITSSVIGFLIKFIKKDEMPITIYVANDELYEMLDDMSLIEVLNVRKALAC